MNDPMPVPVSVSEHRSRWGEGPFWCGGNLWYVDIEGKALQAFDPRRGETGSWDMGQRIGFARPLADGGLVWGGDRGLYLRKTPAGGDLLLPGTQPESADHRYNDAGVSPDGVLFAGTISLKKIQGSAHLYRVDAQGGRGVAISGVTNSNGIGWTPEGNACFYIDTPRRQVLRYRYEAGRLLDPEVLVETGGIEGSPDGLAVDVAGNLWVAFCHGGCVCAFDGDTGALRQRIDFPCIETTACAFGGAHMRDLYVTTGVAKDREEPEAGRLFVVEDVGVAGVPVVPAAIALPA